jgi:cytochrome P450
VCTRDTEIDGLPITAGALVQLRYSSADRDANLFPAPDEFDVARQNVRQHIAFGHGVHMCIGASLARKEMVVAFRVLLERLKSVALDCPEEELVYPPNVLLRGLQRLPIRFVAA